MLLFYHLLPLLNSLALCHSCSFTKLDWLSFSCSTCPKGNTIADASWWELSSIGCHSQHCQYSLEMAALLAATEHSCSPSWPQTAQHILTHAVPTQGLCPSEASNTQMSQGTWKKGIFWPLLLPVFSGSGEKGGICKPALQQAEVTKRFLRSPSAWKVGTRPSSLRSAVHSLSQRLSVAELIEKNPFRPCWG